MPPATSLKLGSFVIDNLYYTNNWGGSPAFILSGPYAPVGKYALVYGR